MSINPITYTERVVGNFLRYQLSAYPFADPGLHKVESSQEPRPSGLRLKTVRPAHPPRILGRPKAKARVTGTTPARPGISTACPTTRRF